jgi:hypothetical protein
MQISLNYREVESLDLSPGARLRLTTRNGTAWVTQEGIADDFALTSSSPVEITGQGRAVVESLEGNMIIRAEILEFPLRKEALLAAG